MKRGEQSRLRGDFDLSIQNYEEALALAKSRGDISGQVQSFKELGLLFWNIGQIESSTMFYQKALSLTDETNPEVRREILDKIEIAKFYQDGKLFRERSLYSNSKASFTQAVALARKIESREHLIKCFRQLGVTFLEMNDKDGFYKTTKQALELAKAIHHRIEVGRCSYNIGLYYSDRHDYSLALKYYEDALSIFRDKKSLPDESNSLVNISDIYIQLGHYEKALQKLKDVLQIDRQMDEDLFVAMDLNNIGVIYRKMGLERDQSDNLFKALAAFEESLAISRQTKEKKIEVQCLNNIGTVYTDLKKFTEALRFLSEGLRIAEELGDKEEIATILLNLGMVYTHKGRYELAVEVVDRAIELAYQINNKNILWEAHAKAGLALRGMKNYFPALEHLYRSIEYIEDIRSKIHLEELKARFFGSDERLDSYYSLVDLLYKMSREYTDRNFMEKAFEIMEKAKARAFLDRLEMSPIKFGGDVNPDLLDKENELKREISNINSSLIQPGLDWEQKEELLNRLSVFEQELEIVNRNIRLICPAYANLKYPQPVTLEEARASLPNASTAYFAYCIGQNSSYSFVITKDGFKVFTLPSAEALRVDVKDYLGVITDKDRLDFHTGYRLFADLVEPGLDPTIDRIIFIPDDILHFFPFETLVTRKDDVHWLAQDYRVSYAPSITSYREILLRKSGGTQKKDILSFGNPQLGDLEGQQIGYAAMFSNETRNNFRLHPLKYSQSEVDKIAALFKRNKRDIYTGEAATEACLKNAILTDYKILHFATHGLIDNRNPARSSIVLSLNDQTYEDGFLQMREVFDLKMDADLVTLSACQTGLGQFIRGEGIEGLNRAFFFAGASSVLMSLWPVNDQASYQFMQRFYTHLRLSDSPVEALRSAKIELINSKILSHPFFWAGFVISGRVDEGLFPPGRRGRIFQAILMTLLLGMVLLIVVRSHAAKS